MTDNMSESEIIAPANGFKICKLTGKPKFNGNDSDFNEYFQEWTACEGDEPDYSDKKAFNAWYEKREKKIEEEKARYVMTYDLEAFEHVEHEWKLGDNPDIVTIHLHPSQLQRTACGINLHDYEFESTWNKVEKSRVCPKCLEFETAWRISQMGSRPPLSAETNLFSDIPPSDSGRGIVGKSDDDYLPGFVDVGWEPEEVDEDNDWREEW